jgi:hypothetical protein
MVERNLDRVVSSGERCGIDEGSEPEMSEGPNAMKVAVDVGPKVKFPLTLNEALVISISVPSIAKDPFINMGTFI